MLKSRLLTTLQPQDQDLIKYDIAVVGAGGAGQMALLRAVLNHLRTVVFLGSTETIRRSREAWVSSVENIPGMFARENPISSTTEETIQFIESRPELKPFLTLVKDRAESIKKQGDHFILSSRNQTFYSRFVLLCTGTMDIQPEIKGSIEAIFPYANRGDVYYCLFCDGHRIAGKDCAVIGTSETAAWVAIILYERYRPPQIRLLTHGKRFAGSGEVLELLNRYQIEILEGEIENILGDPSRGLEGFQVAGVKAPAQKAFVMMGSLVYNDLAKQLGVELDKRHHVITNEKGETSVAGFYAAGDLVSGKKKQVYTAWDMAVDAVSDIDEKVRILKRQGM